MGKIGEEENSDFGESLLLKRLGMGKGGPQIKTPTAAKLSGNADKGFLWPDQKWTCSRAFYR